MKTLILLSSLVFLASCTRTPSVPQTPPPPPVMEDATMKQDVPVSGTETMDDKKMMPDSGAPEAVDAQSKTDDTMMKKDEGAMMKPTGYMVYDAAKVDEALASGQKVALFFHATWCPSCRGLDKAITTDVSSIPSDALIVKVDYDSSDELKKKYRVVGQHTIVLLNADGTEKSKKLGAKDIAEVLN